MRNNEYVFLIDNDTDDLEIFKTAIYELDNRIKVAAESNAVHAIEKLRQDVNSIPTVIIVDMNMPLLTGQECLMMIKQMDHLKSVPVYIFSTASAPPFIEESKKYGANDFIVKPTSYKALKQILLNIFPGYINENN